MSLGRKITFTSCGILPHTIQMISHGIFPWILIADVFNGMLFEGKQVLAADKLVRTEGECL